MRERLIELIIDKLITQAFDNGEYIETEVNVDEIADYLLENRVVVLQCEIGDTVYQTDGIRIYELEVFDVSIHRNKPYYETESIDFDDDAIGETVFLTRKEAEKALKGGAE